MADIFLAYSRANSQKADQFRAAFKKEGYSVFVDVNTPTGARWREHIETQLNACDVLVVLWSKTSVKSDYVKEEADVAKDSKKLFPVMITKCDLPYGFRSYQTLDLTSWRGDLNAPQWRRLIEDIRSRS
ncbi:MAG: toll/interleukin-1 receptor domain-containing protein [Planctomycetes bacterium]|nr:toll/interleukin-1 receptor domain-containing protein [Planctomycetota bacterium]